jgi:hypothetical protein
MCDLEPIHSLMDVGVIELTPEPIGWELNVAL